MNKEDNMFVKAKYIAHTTPFIVSSVTCYLESYNVMTSYYIFHLKKYFTPICEKVSISLWVLGVGSA